MYFLYFIILSLSFSITQGMDKIGYWETFNNKKQTISGFTKLLFLPKNTPLTPQVETPQKANDQNNPIACLTNGCYTEDDFSGKNNDNDICCDDELTQQEKAFASIANKAGTFYKYSGLAKTNGNKIEVIFSYQGCKNRPSGNPDWLKNIDIETLEEDTKNNDAVFQVASRFHCNEGGDYRLPISTYFEAKPQGQTAARAALAGTLWRKYGFILNDLDLLTRFHQIYKPSELYQSGNYDTANGGISYLKDNYELEKKSIEEIAELIDVGVQENTYSTKKNNKIHQIFASTISNPSNNTEKHFTKACLKTAYDNTLQWAWENNKSTVYLTLIGGGVFNNPPELIFKAIQNACTKLYSTHYRKNPLQVILVGYANKNYLEDYKQLSEKTGGAFTVYDQE